MIGFVTAALLRLQGRNLGFKGRKYREVWACPNSFKRPRTLIGPSIMMSRRRQYAGLLAHNQFPQGDAPGKFRLETVKPAQAAFGLGATPGLRRFHHGFLHHARGSSGKCAIAGRVVCGFQPSSGMCISS